MARHIVLLRGINIGPNNRIAMPQLRELLTGAGYDNVRTYVQSGNVLLDSDDTPDSVAERTGQLIAEELALSIPVVTRSRDEIAAVVKRDPLGRWADNPKRYQVTFLADEIDQEMIDKLAGCALPEERFAAHGRELYAWHPEGVARSKLATSLAGRGLGTTTTARNWTTVTTLLQLADE
jgi:uncharacterized protein (DUF1697 family)